jgi:alpha-amylase
MKSNRLPGWVTGFLLLIAMIAGLLSSCSAGNNPLVTGTNGQPWWNDTVYYEIFVRSFKDSNGDGVGDFNGVTEKLDYLADLGIRGIWLMPVFPSPSYHGYDVTDYYSVNPAYGKMEDFKRLLGEAHKRGIRIILDLVLNHTSSQHPWFKQAQDPASSYRDWYIWSETDPGYLGPWSEKVWYPSASGGYYYGVFTDQMPDLNYRNPQVTQEMEKITKFWLDLGVDGYRLDGARHLIEEGKTQADSPATLAWFKNYKPFYKGINSQAMVVGEVASTSIVAAQYVKQGGMDLTFDFDQAGAWLKGVLNASSEQLASSTSFENTVFPNQQMATFLSNHDQDRVMSQLLGSVEKAKAAATILLTAPGVPFVYYGEEIGMTGSGKDENKRTPMQWSAASRADFSTVSPWEPVNSDFTQKNVDAESKDPNSLYNFYKTLIRARNLHEALRVGSLVKVDTGNPKVFAMLRSTEKESVLVLINLDKEAVSSYKISISNSTLKGSYRPEALVGAGTFSPLNVTDQGSVTGYQPVSSLPGYANWVILLKPGN